MLTIVWVFKKLHLHNCYIIHVSWLILIGDVSDPITDLSTGHYAVCTHFAMTMVGQPVSKLSNRNIRIPSKIAHRIGIRLLDNPALYSSFFYLKFFSFQLNFVLSDRLDCSNTSYRVPDIWCRESFESIE